ncbi:GGDEF domain-containing protein [Malonomonas rubra]
MILELQDAKKKVDRLVLKLQESNSRLRELVYQDALTGLYNHRYFQETLESEMARAKRYQASLSLVLFDIDNFKAVNDSFGHPAGDLVLMNIATAVKGAVRNSDVVARFGGDEFAIILPSTNAAGAKTFAENLRLAVEGIASLIDGQAISATVSLGVVTVLPSQASMSKSELIEIADNNLYQAKQQGRNRVTCSTVGS